MKTNDPKVSVITGASGGIGHAIAMAFMRRGDRVILADIQPPEINSFSDAGDLTENARQNTSAKAIDLTCTESVNAFAEDVLKEHGRVDCIVNAAGILRVGSFYELTDDDWDSTLAVNLKGAFLLSRAFVGSMIAQSWGRIVHIGSTASITASPGGAIYAASKHGLLGLVRGMACDVSKYGVTVNLLCPGNTDTPMLRDVLAERSQRQGRSEEELLAELAAKTPTGRIGKPEDLAGAAVFLTSDEAENITGQSLIVDGGRSLNLV